MSTKLDTVTLEVIRNALPAVANEMAADLQRTSYNMMIYEVRDYCTALLGLKGELISQNVGGVSHFVADLGVLVTDGMQRYGANGFKPGDVIITNHQAVAGQHLNNVVIYMPYFYKGELLMFLMVRAHWIDVGGTSTGFGAGATVADPWLEGLQLDQLKIYEEGKLSDPLYRVIKDNIRFPESSLGDMKSQMAACRLAGRRLDELFDKYGRDTLLVASSVDECDVPVPQPRQVVHGHPHRGRDVDVDIVQAGEVAGAADEREGRVQSAQCFHPRIVQLHRHQQHPVDELLPHQGDQFVAVVAHRPDHQMVVGVLRGLRGAEDELPGGRPRPQPRERRDEREDLGAATGQRTRDDVGPEAELGHRPFDPPPGLGRDRFGVVDHERNRRDRHPCRLRDLPHGDRHSRVLRSPVWKDLLTTRRLAPTLYREPGIALNQPIPIILRNHPAHLVKRYTIVTSSQPKELHRR